MLRTTIKQLGKHSVVYGLGSILTRLLGFVLLPLYTRYLSVADYGLYTLLAITMTVTTVIAQVGMGSALFREVIYQESEESTVISTALYYLLAEAVLLFIPLYILANPISQLIFRTPEYGYLLRLVFLAGLLHLLDALLLSRLRIHNASALYASIAVAKFLVGAGLNIYLIVVLRLGVEGLIIGALILAGLSAIVDLLLLLRAVRLTFSVPILRRLLSFGVPLVPYGLSSLLMTYADRYILERLSTMTEVGLYSLGYSIGLVVNLAVGAVQLAWPAQMFAIAKKPGAERQLARMLTYYLLAMGLLWLGLSVLAREVLYFMTTPPYYAAFKVVPLIALSYILYGVMYMTNSGLETRNKTRYMSITILCSAALNLLLCFLLIPSYGMLGAAWATVLSYLALASAQVLLNLRFWRIPYEYGRIARIAFLCGAVYGVSLLIQTPSVWLNVALKALLLISYPFLLYLVRFYEKSEVAALVQLWQQGLRRLRREKSL